jgi:hypothetical protein
LGFHVLHFLCQPLPLRPDLFLLPAGFFSTHRLQFTLRARLGLLGDALLFLRLTAAAILRGVILSPRWPKREQERPQAEHQQQSNSRQRAGSPAVHDHGESSP